MSFATEAGVDFDGASSVSYASEESDGTAIETGTGVLAKTQTQFGFSVAKGFDGRIERITQQSFTRNGDDAANATVDELAFVFTNDESGLEANLVVTDLDVEFAGNFDNDATVAANQVEAADILVAAARYYGLLLLISHQLP
eukprot:UN13712